MGRAEKRRKERQNRINERKGKMLMSHDDIQNVKQKTLDEYDDFRIETMLTCFALINHRLYGHGAKRTLRTLNAVNELTAQFASENITIEQMKQMVEDEIRINLKFN